MPFFRQQGRRRGTGGPGSDDNGVKIGFGGNQNTFAGTFGQSQTQLDSFKNENKPLGGVFGGVSGGVAGAGYDACAHNACPQVPSSSDVVQ